MLLQHLRTRLVAETKFIQPCLPSPARDRLQDRTGIQLAERVRRTAADRFSTMRPGLSVNLRYACDHRSDGPCTLRNLGRMNLYVLRTSILVQLGSAGARECRQS
jgi:hypothetical protein